MGRSGYGACPRCLEFPASLMATGDLLRSAMDGYGVRRASDSIGTLRPAQRMALTGLVMSGRRKTGFRRMDLSVWPMATASLWRSGKDTFWMETDLEPSRPRPTG